MHGGHLVGNFQVGLDLHFPEWEMPHFPAGGLGDRFNHSSGQFSYAMMNTTENALLGSPSGVNIAQKGDQIQPQTALGLGSLFHSDKDRAPSHLTTQVHSICMAS